MVHFPFPRQLRLLSASEFSFVFQQATRAAAPQLILLARPNGLGYPRLGITIAKKQVKRAYQRNRCKRLLREYFRLHQHALPAMDFIALAKKGIEALDNQRFTALADKLWQRHGCQPVEFPKCTGC